MHFHPKLMLAAAMFVVGSIGAFAQAGSIPVTIDEDGTAHLPAQAIPNSSLMSKEGNDSRTYFLRFPAGQPAVNGRLPINAPYVERAQKMFPVNIEDTKIGGIHVLVYTPKDGIAPHNKQRVLIDLHGRGCFLDCGNLESMPVAFKAKIKVISIDYREPNPAPIMEGIEDVATVYRELLKTYSPSNIGIYGCSQGGSLTAHSLAYFQKQGLPNPAAAGILCSGGFASAVSSPGPADGDYTARPLGEGRIPPPRPRPSQADLDNPIMNPVNFPAVMAKYPPTLIITGTRAMEMSSAVYFHTQLVKAGNESDLHVWEGGRHAFWFDPGMPESNEATDVIVKFFEKYLGKSPAKH